MPENDSKRRRTVTRLLAKYLVSPALWFLACALYLSPRVAVAQCNITQTTPAQQALCAAAAASGAVNTIVSNYGTTNVALQQLSTQSDIQLNTTVISSPAAQ